MNVCLRAIDRVRQLSARNPLLFATCLIPFFEPTFIEDNIPILDKVFLIAQLLSMTVALLVFTTKGIKLTPFYLCVIGYQGYLCIVTLYRGGNLFGIVSSSARVFTLATLLEVSLRQNPDTTMKLIRNYSLILLAIMFASAVIAPQGLYVSPNASGSNNPDNVNYIRFFLGHKNNVLPFLFPGFAAATVLWAREKSNNKSAAAALIYYVMLFLTLVIVDSKTSMVVCAIMVAAVFLAKIKFVQMVNPFGWFAGAVAGDVLITICRIQNLIPGVTELLGRDVTFSGRAAIWDSAEEIILERPLFGYGFEHTEIAKTRFPLDSFSSAHNIYYTAGYYGGVVALLFLLSSIVLAYKELAGRNSEISAFMALFLFAILIEGIFETVGIGGLTLLICPLAMVHCTPYLDLRSDDTSRNNCRTMC